MHISEFTSPLQKVVSKKGTSSKNSHTKVLSSLLNPQDGRCHILTACTFLLYAALLYHKYNVLRNSIIKSETRSLMSNGSDAMPCVTLWNLIICKILRLHLH